VQAIDAWFALKMRAVQVFSALFCGWCAARRVPDTETGELTWLRAPQVSGVGGVLALRLPRGLHRASHLEPLPGNLPF
jgi:hypothetical protein